MRLLMVILSMIALLILFALPTVHAMNWISRDAGQYGIVVGTIFWFATSPFWIRMQKN